MKETFHKTKVAVFFLGLFILLVTMESIRQFHTNHETLVDMFLASLVLFAVSLLWFERHLYKYVRQCGREDFNPNFGPLYVGEVRLTENGKDRNFYIIGNIPVYGLSDFSDILRTNTSLKVSWYITIVTTLAIIYCVATFATFATSDFESFFMRIASLISFAVPLLWFEGHLYKYVRQCGREDFKPNFGPLYVGGVRLTENGKDRNFYIIGNIPFYGLSDFSDILRTNTSLKVSWYITIVTTLAIIYFAL